MSPDELLKRDGQIRVRSETFGVEFYICSDRKLYTKRVLEKAICFSINEIKTLVDEAPGPDIIRDALSLKASNPGVFVVSFIGRKYQYWRPDHG